MKSSLLRAASALVAGAALAGCSGGGSGGGAAGDPTEAFSGGAATVFDATQDAFSFRVPALTGTRADTFQVGDAFFNTNWVTAPSSTGGRDGLGPVFNAASCEACHPKDGRGRPPAMPGDPFVSLLVKLSVPGAGPTDPPVAEPSYGFQLQHRSIQGVPAEGDVTVTYSDVAGTFGDGAPFTLQAPTYDFPTLNFGALAQDVQVSPRVGPQVIGLGLLASIADADIEALADPQDQDQDGISGRANRVLDVKTGQMDALGRFGWKAGQPTLEQQVAAAFLNDIGLTNPIFSTENCAAPQTDCQGAPNGGSPEVDQQVLDFVTFYVHTLAVPGRRNAQDPEVRRGSEVFDAIGCASCHVRTLVTGTNPDFPELSGQVIHPFTDLLLHDMGPGLADDRPESLADGQEWRTPPLWGVGLFQVVNGHSRYLHDGRARDLTEAVLWHGGEAEDAREAFRTLPAADRDALIRFLEDL